MAKLVRKESFVSARQLTKSYEKAFDKGRMPKVMLDGLRMETIFQSKELWKDLMLV